MAKDPAFLFYSKDWVEGTTIMNFEDRGKYIHILAVMHQQGRLDEETIRFMVGSISDKLRSKFQVDENGLWFNTKLENETEKRNNFLQSRHSNGKKGGRPKTGEKPLGYPYGKPNGKPKNNLPGNGIVNENEEENINISFAEFWELYDKKVGDKTKLGKKWLSLTDEERLKAMNHIPEYKTAQPDKKFRKDPATYLNNNSFNDEIIKSNADTKTGSALNSKNGGLQLALNGLKSAIQDAAAGGTANNGCEI